MTVLVRTAQFKVTWPLLVRGTETSCVGVRHIFERGWSSLALSVWNGGDTYSSRHFQVGLVWVAEWNKGKILFLLTRHLIWVDVGLACLCMWCFHSPALSSSGRAEGILNALAPTASPSLMQ